MNAVDELDRRLTDAGFRGAVRIEQGADVLIDRAYGEDGAGVPFTTGTASQIASISKSFTAACALLLVDEARLAFDDRLVAFLDARPAAWNDITIRHLLTHTSGLVHWGDVPGHDHYSPCPRDELIAKFAAAPLLFEPGSSWSYSSPGFVLLAHVVETISGESYPVFLRENVLEPLGLRRTAADDTPPGGPAAHGSRGGEPVPSFDLAVNVGTGDVWSTTGDLIRWPTALASCESLSAATRGAAQSRQTPTTRDIPGIEDVGYGFGWFTATLDGAPMIFHSGDNAGFVSLLVWLPDEELRLAMLAPDEINLGELAFPALARLLRAT
ncbi:MAG TPA: serine hydrolase domain-containing protein [Gaiellaceae bacterium]|jgi:CubicO group peptidase (beta-lactamase class C family)